MARGNKTPNSWPRAATKDMTPRQHARVTAKVLKAEEAEKARKKKAAKKRK